MVTGNKIKLLGICASARGKDSNSYFLMKRAFDALSDSGVEKEIIVASELNIRPCAHHYSVNAKMCVHPCLITQIDTEDEMKKIYDGILGADVVVFSTPIYWGNHSQLMQLIVERLNSLENAYTTHKQVVIKNKIAGLMVVGHEDGYQHVVGGLMNFLTCLGMIFPSHAYAAWVGESTTDPAIDKEKITTESLIKKEFEDLATNCVNFAKKIIYE
jgi:multimeric flavodoxin WrbA